ncbi:TIGR03885 family FMN-dependent LLM class oxidoreductase [Flaviflagellibacter deserti]|uniref:TIGR03885 family FMN-dependent LLM class oxidoreductase n=1 Tax=Flaviflagellibacter deserti TaxID=2267266 RepID=A0ABV9YZ14_9HYPH
MTIRIGYHASHEQFSPRELIGYVKQASNAGFVAAMSSDHFAPWSERQGHSGFVWAWLGAALQSTDAMTLGLITVPGGWRYHPAIVAQAIATTVDMFPRRLPWVALGSGEEMNEHVVGDRWPSKQERNDRLRAATDIIRELLAGGTVTTRHPIAVNEAKLYTRPLETPKLLIAALTADTARWAGGFADGLLMVNQSRDAMKNMIQEFHAGGGEGKPIVLQVHVSYAEGNDAARLNAYDQWRSNAITASLAANLRHPADFDGASKHVRPEDMDEYVRISSDLNRHVSWLKEDADMGVSEIFLHNVGRNQTEFIEAFGIDVLPSFAT